MNELVRHLLIAIATIIVLLAIALGPREAFIVAIAIVGWVGVARLTRGQVLSLKEREFVEAARSIGAPSRRIMTRHLLPNVLPVLIVSAAFSVPGAILGEATLSFLGVGIVPPTPSWGQMINEGFPLFSSNPWAVVLPAICISVVMLAFTFVGDGLRDASGVAAERNPPNAVDNTPWGRDANPAS